MKKNIEKTNKQLADKKYYTNLKDELLKQYDDEARTWSPFVFGQYGEINAWRTLQDARKAFEELIPQIPYIGGDENTLTAGLIESVRYLAFYLAMKKHGKTAEEAGKILYDAILARLDKPQKSAPGKKMAKGQFIEQQRQRTAKNAALKFPGNFVCAFVEGDGKTFDYGYDLPPAPLKILPRPGRGRIHAVLLLPGLPAQ